MTPVLTLRMRHWFYWAKKSMFVSQFSEIITSISRFIEPIQGMLVLIWMHFSCSFQIWSWNSTILTFFTTFFWFFFELSSALACRVESIHTSSKLYILIGVFYNDDWVHVKQLKSAEARRRSWLIRRPSRRDKQRLVSHDVDI